MSEQKTNNGRYVAYFGVFSVVALFFYGFTSLIVLIKVSLLLMFAVLFAKL